MFSDEREAGGGAIGFLNFDACDCAVGGYGEGETLDAFLLIVGNSSQAEVAVGDR